ncbi:LOW QUALITY PROTEIN: hypothetical protein CVT26_015553 [Gymnopilus dilepis]|uniref:Nephrocystin 3-like N-terminal domain-containing protein n=1 Tax=Gymnopilus dilepis TaxID=231916 RepID=A0A409YD69_9AGAR|nr:LOW QUALITY PROTEIN: hypothetical protein CVT26_015553 [Gymnopilus dilepis]
MDMPGEKPMTAGPSMISVSNSVITGGTYTQHIVNEIQRVRPGFELLREAIAPSAFHNSGERFDPPKCHPNTRSNVLQKIMDWITDQDPDTKGAMIMWLYGAAGAGKSAIAQTIAEMCYAQGLLAGSFFFGRSDPTRNHGRPLFPTLAYQMGLVFPQFRQKLDHILTHDPTLPTRSLATQLTAILLQPLLALASEKVSSPAHLFIIDGLDECLDQAVQCQILEVIFTFVRTFGLRLKFLIASRPEHEITTTFNAFQLDGRLSRIALDEDYQSYEDIQQFLIDKFQEIVATHPFRHRLPSPWPNPDDLRHLVQKSSGQFVYASTIIKYVGGSKRLPHHRLDVIMQLRSAGRDLPFAELDALYKHIFASLDKADVVLILLIIAFPMICDRNLTFATCDVFAIGKILALDPGEVEMLFCDLASVAVLKETIIEAEKDFSRIEQAKGREVTALSILHASLFDFLQDKSRSGPYYLDVQAVRLELVQKCICFINICLENLGEALLKIWLDESFDDLENADAHFEALKCFINNLDRALSAPALHDDISSFDIAMKFNEIYAATGTSTVEKLRHTLYFRSEFLPLFFDILNYLGQSVVSLYTQHLSSFDSVLSEYIAFYYTDVHLTFLLTLVDYVVTEHPTNSSGDWSFWYIEAFKSLRDKDTRRLALLEPRYSDGRNRLPFKYYEHIQRYLADPSRSGAHALNGDRYAAGARSILLMYKKKPHLVRFDYAQRNFLVFALERASRSKELVILCREALIKIPYRPDVEQAMENYLRRADL